MRRKRQPRRRESARERRVLPVPGTPSSSMWPPASSEVIASVLTRSCPRMTRSSCWRSAPNRVAISLMLCIRPPLYGGEFSKCVVDALQTKAECRPSAASHELRHAFLQRLASQSSLRGHRPRERVLIERQRLGVGHRFLVQRAKRRDEIDGVRSRIAKFFLGRSDARRAAPQLQQRDHENQEKERSEPPLFQEIERTVGARQAVHILVEIDRTRDTGKRNQKGKMISDSEILVLEHLRDGNDDDVACA